MPPEGGKNIQIPSVVFGVFIQNFIKATGRSSITGYSSGYAQADFAVESINITDVQSTVIAGLLACIDSKLAVGAINSSAILLASVMGRKP